MGHLDFLPSAKKKSLVISPLLLTLAALGCRARDERSSAVKATPVSLNTESVNLEVVAAYKNEMKTYISTSAQKPAWNWYMYHPHGFQGIPMVIIKLLPELDPDIWGTAAEKFAKFGHFVLPGDENRALPSSIGMASFPVSGDPQSQLILTTETCGTCHTGQVRVPGAGNGDIVFLYGGVNTKFDLRKWRTAMEATAQKYLATDEDLQRTASFMRRTMAAKEPGFFDKNPEEDANQRNLASAVGVTETILKDFATKAAVFTEGKKKQREGPYLPSASAPIPSLNEGNPGHLDASGDLLGQRLSTMVGMPAFPSLTDTPSVWRQDERNVGQWDGSVSDAFIRNLAAQIAVVPGPTVDRRVAAFAKTFTHDLPAPKFPFRRNGGKDLLEKGRTLFAQNCADCHKPLNAQFYAQLGTDMNRARVMSKEGSMRIGQIFADACAATPPGEVTPPPPPCDPDWHTRLRYTGIPQNQGYAAPMLTGIWARAPYLHNGSVPTLRHLLLPSTRPSQFVVGSISYDAENVGYNWEASKLAAYQLVDPEARILDTKMASLGNGGHDQRDLIVGEKHYRLDWTPTADDNPEAVDALLAYLTSL